MIFIHLLSVPCIKDWALYMQFIKSEDNFGYSHILQTSLCSSEFHFISFVKWIDIPTCRKQIANVNVTNASKCNQCQFHKLNGYLAEIISCETIKCGKFSQLQKIMGRIWYSELQVNATFFQPWSSVFSYISYVLAFHIWLLKMHIMGRTLGTL